LDPKDPYRTQICDALLSKVYQMGLITSKDSLSKCYKITVSSFCRRRLPIVMVRLKMAETVQEAVTFVEQGREYYKNSIITPFFSLSFSFCFLAL